MAYENKALRCRNCTYWWPLADDQQEDDRLRMHATRGQCRRHAPPPGSIEQEWAITRPDDWCGEHLHVMA